MGLQWAKTAVGQHMAIFNHFSLGIHLFKKVVFAILPGNCLLLFTTILNYLLETFVNGEMTPAGEDTHRKLGADVYVNNVERFCC